MKDKNRDLVRKSETNNKYRTSSALLCLNKDYIKSARRLRKIAEGIEEASLSEIRALEAIITILLPFDPMVANASVVSSTGLTMKSQ